MVTRKQRRSLGKGEGGKKKKGREEEERGHEKEPTQNSAEGIKGPFNLLLSRLTSVPSPPSPLQLPAEGEIGDGAAEDPTSLALNKLNVSAQVPVCGVRPPLLSRSRFIM